MPAMVLDSYALIAYFRGESAGVPVKELLEKAGKADKPLHMTEVNYAETKYMILRKNGAAAWEAADKVLVALPIEFHAVERDMADMAADLKSRHTFSLADAFAAALAKMLKAGLATGDPEFKAVENEIKIHWLQSRDWNPS